MGFDLNGYVLRPARVATGNSSDSDEATTGVDRDHITVTTMTALGYVVLPTDPVEPYADMYRAAVLLQPADRAASREYCMFAASNGFLSDTTDEVKFWWTRNDPDVQRFGWDGIAQKWLPLKGAPAQNLGPVDPDESYTLNPPPTRFASPVTLPNPASADGYALVRVGLYSDSGSTPLVIRAVTDVVADAGVWDGGSGDAIMGEKSGILILNPTFVESQAGRDLWYNAETFVPGADGDMGTMADFPTSTQQGFPSISPVPGPGERPLLRIGSRTWLTPNSVVNDAALPLPSAITTGEFYWSRTTGRIVLSAADILRSTPGDGTYDRAYLGSRLYFDGVVLSTKAVTVKAPSVIYDSTGQKVDPALGGVTVGNSTGDLYVQRSVCLPPPGISGVSWVPDGSGDKPTTAALSTTPQTRPNGTGLVRQVRAEAGDTFFFSFTDTTNFAFENVDAEEYDEDLLKLKIKVPKTDVAVARMEPSTTPAGADNASRIQLRHRPIRQGALYFRQAMLAPSTYAEDATIYSRFEGPYTLVGTEVLRYAIDGVVHTWSAATLGAGTHTASAVAASFTAGHAGVERNRVYLQSPTPATGAVEIGWNTDQTDLSGHAVLGFLPGWRVDYRAGQTQCRWLPDNGASMGVFRSPVNLDRSDPDTLDIRARSRFKDEVLSESIPAVPFVTVNQPPLENIDGYGPDQHFKVQIGLLEVLLRNYPNTKKIGMEYDWPNNRFTWVEQGTTNPTSIAFPSPTLQLSDTGVVPVTVSSAAMGDGSFGLDLKGATDTSYTELALGTDFLMPGDGQPGQAVRISVEGEIISQGGNGTFASGTATFTDPNTPLGTVFPGYLLHIISGDAEGVYTFTSTTDVTPPFPASAGSANTAPPAQWRIYKAQQRTALDGTLLADVKQVVTNHLPEEPFKIRLLTSAGTVGGALTVNPVDALRVGRVTKLRFGLAAGSPEATPTYLTRGVEIGTVVATGLTVDATDPHVATSDSGPVRFQIRIGALVYTPTVNGGGGQVDVDTTTGAVTIDAAVVSAQTGSSVFYDQLFLSPSDLAAGTCEINAADGSVNITSSALLTQSGKTVYFVEQMITENSLDVTTSPVNGSVLFNKPLRKGQIVEVSYYQADSNGDKKLDASGAAVEITEFLPLIVRLEEATRVDGFTYTYNPMGKTLSTTVEEFIWVGVELQNFAGVTTATAENGTITFVSEVSTTDKVQINYGVLEAFGGEQAYTVSTPPVYRKPFWLDVGASDFTLETNRTSDFPVGHLILLGAAPLYITAVTYDVTANTTKVTISPTTQVEIGSRAVGRDAGLTVSDFPVAPATNPATGGFMPVLDTVTTPLLPADKGQLEVSFYGDVRQYTRANHLLEIDGYPYIVVGSSLSDDGRNTVVNLATPVYKDHDNTHVVRVSVRPVYAPSPVQFAGLSPFVQSEDYDLFLLGRKNSSGASIPGKLLVEDVHYTVDANSGDVIFQSPTQGALNPGEYLHFRHTRLVNVLPEIVDGALLYPFHKAKYLHTTTPSLKNHLLGQVLKAQYSYRDPDSFYFSVLTLTDYLPKVQAASGAQGASAVSYGASVPFGGSTDLSKKGNFGLRGEARDFKDQDRAARAYISLFNEVVLAFEQVLEAIDGRIIGDRDGKFRFFVGRGKRYVRPGFEDEITGDLRTRLVWREIVNEWSSNSFAGWYKTADPVFDPTTAEVPDAANRPGASDGKTPNPDTLQFFTNKQRRRIKNDMDDRLLIGFGRPRGRAALFPSFDIPGLFRSMWQAHRYSRLYPEMTRHFSRLFPGIDFVPGSDPGYYTSGRKVSVPGPEPGEETEQVVKTRKGAIGQIANPALGNVENVVDVTAEDRRPRARVWAYYPNGNTDLGTSSATIVATPLPLSEFPVDPTTGLPDPTQLISGGGALFDLVSGDVDLSTPAFAVGQQLGYGKPNDTIYALTDASSSPAGQGVFVKSVTNGYIIELGNKSGAALSGSNVLYNGIDPLEEIISGDEGYGDTVFSTTLVDLTALPGSTATPTTQDELNAITAALPDYRIQYDLKVGKRSGEFIDASLPVKEDVFPLPLQTWLNQNPPQPMTCIEGEVEFVNTDGEPAQLPCLLGEDKDDTGDYQIPYIRGADTELSVLGRVAADFRLLFEDTTAVTIHTWKAIYPDEIIGSDGLVYTSGYDIVTQRDPATLYTSTDLTPVATAGYTANSGIGDARPYDFLFMQTGQTGVPAGITGILSIGDVTTNKIETPRFVTPIPATKTIKHTIQNAAVAVNRSGAEGVVVTRANPAPGLYAYTFNCDSVGFVLDDGAGGGPPGVGGFNQFLAVGRVAILRIYDPNNGALVEFIAVSGATVWSTSFPGGIAVVGAPHFRNGQLFVSTNSILLSTVANNGNLYDVTVSADSYIDATTSALTGLAVGSGVGTITASIQSDRLTFAETTSLANAAARGTTTASPGALDVGTTLAVWEVQIDGASGSTINSPNSVNGNVPFTFLERLNGVVPYVGKFTAATASGAGDESGTIKVMPWEKNGNLPLDASDLTGVKFGAAASSDAGKTSLILSGTGVSFDKFGTFGHRTWVQQDTTHSTFGSISNVESGDAFIIEGGIAANSGAVKTGTYLVRHAVDHNAVANDTTRIRQEAPQADAGKEQAFDLTFPTILSSVSTGGSESITTTSLAVAATSPTGHAWASAGRIYLIIKDNYATYDSVGPTWTVDANAVYSADYTGITINADTGAATFTGLSTAQDAHGTGISVATFIAKALRNVKVSGMVYVPVRQLTASLPKNNCVGYREDPNPPGGVPANPANACVGGFRSLRIGNTHTNGGDVLYTAGLTGSLQRVTGTQPSANRIGINVPAAPNDSLAFNAERSTPIYSADKLALPSEWQVTGVPTYLTVVQLSDGDWEAIHFDNPATITTTTNLGCFLPSDRIRAASAFSGGTGTFYALAGVFLEPSTPVPVGDLGQTIPHVVSASFTAASVGQIGMRDYDDFNTVNTGKEGVRFAVRRIRRFHAQADEIVAGLDPLRFAYEIRRGEVGSYTAGSRKFVASLAGAYSKATNLGAFDNPDVNINSGDVLRVFSFDAATSVKTLIDTAEVQKVVDPVTLKLRRPGLTEVIPAGALFEVFLEQAIVPHEQSNEQLLDLITDKVVFQRFVPRTSPTENGGQVATANELGDSGVTDWSAATAAQTGETVAENDYIVVDPAGKLYTDTEFGSRPVGDTSVSERGAIHATGTPSDLDDNRGFYRVSATPSGATLTVTGSSRFTDGTKFGNAGAEYVAMPIVSGGAEGQQDLRVTQAAVGTSFIDRGVNKSIQPFAYKIIRPNPVFSQDAVELVLFMRERMLSWIGALNTVYSQGGDYYVFQRDDHIKDIGSNTDPTAGLGVLHNIAATSLQGLVATTPFANNSQCLSVLDRRFWVLDSRLDSLGYTNFAVDGFGQRPVLPDLIEDVLDLDDRFRQQRYGWISFRANRTSGSIQTANRAAGSLGSRLRKQREELARQKALDDS